MVREEFEFDVCENWSMVDIGQWSWPYIHMTYEYNIYVYIGIAIVAINETINTGVTGALTHSVCLAQ